MTDRADPAGELALLTDAAREAGRLVLSMAAGNLQTQRKRDGSPVTAIDLAVDAMLRERLLGARPDHGWLSEESPDDGSRHTRARLFVVDPLDGTYAFMRGRSDWCIALAVIEAGRAVLGVVHAPALSLTVAGGPGVGVFENGRRVRVSDPGNLEGARVIGSPAWYRHPDWSPPWPTLNVRKVASACLRLAEIARGAADFTMALGHRAPWDSAPGVALVEGAGGRATLADGAPAIFNTAADAGIGSVVAAGPKTHRLLIDHLAAARR